MQVDPGNRGIGGAVENVAARADNPLDAMKATSKGRGPRAHNVLALNGDSNDAVVIFLVQAEPFLPSIFCRHGSLAPLACVGSDSCAIANPETFFGHDIYDSTDEGIIARGQGVNRGHTHANEGATILRIGSRGRGIR